MVDLLAANWHAQASHLCTCMAVVQIRKVSQLVEPQSQTNQLQGMPMLRPTALGPGCCNFAATAAKQQQSLTAAE